MSTMPTTVSASGLSPFATTDELVENQHHSQTLPPRAGIVATFAQHLRALVAWRLERRALTQLQQLDDRILRDIGLTRSDIVSAPCRCDRDRIKRWA